MIELGNTLTIEGRQILRDTDPDQFWVMPGPVQLARRGPDNEPQFFLIMYSPETAGSGVRGGGFMTFEVNLALDPDLERRILSRLASLAEGQPRLAPVPFDKGTVKAIALNLQGSGGASAGGTTAPEPSPGTFNAVEQILGASIPSLQNENTAAFSLTLSQEGAIILEKAFSDGAEPVGVVYELTFTGLRPALDVEITVDFKRVFDHFSWGLDASVGFEIYGVPVFLKADIDAAFEKLVQDGVIEIKVINYTTDEDREKREQWALDFFKNNLLAQWFQPTLTPVKFDDNGGSNGGAAGSSGSGGSGSGAGSSGSGSSGSGSGSGAGGSGGTGSGGDGGASGTGSGGTGSGTGASGGAGSNTGTGSSSGGTGSGGTGSSGGSGSSGSGASGGSGTGSPAPGGEQPKPEAAERQPAELELGGHEPASLPTGYGIGFSASASGTTETLTFNGRSAPTVRVDGTARALTGRQLTLDVQPGAALQIEATYPAVDPETESFQLYFDFDKPDDNGWEVQPRPKYTGYLNNQFSVHGDHRFAISDGSRLPTDPALPGSLVGAPALKTWLNRLAEPKQVTVKGYASYEGDDSEQKRRYNLDLSLRRSEVAVGIVGALAEVTFSDGFGHSQHKADLENLDFNVKTPEDYRAAIVEGAVDHGAPEVTLQASLSRPATTGGTGSGSGSGAGAGSGTGSTGSGSSGSGSGAGSGSSGTGAGTGSGAGSNTGGSGTGTGTGKGSGSGSSGSGGKPGTGLPGTGEQQMGVSVAFKLRMIKQEELKTLTLRYNRAEAVQQTYAPQGFIGLLVDDLDQDKHFIRVSLDHPFFRVFTVTAEAPVDFERIGLTSAHLALDYGDPADAFNHRHKDFVFDRAAHGEQKFEVFMNETFDTDYAYQLQYHFDPLSGWEGEKFTYELPARRTEDRTLLLNPFEDLGFMEIEIFPQQIDAGIVASTDVHLRYASPSGWVAEKVVTVLPDSPPQRWRVRSDDPAARAFTYRFVHHLKNGMVRETAPVTTQAAAVPVDDSFAGALDLEFVPLYDPNQVKMVFIDVEYNDEGNNYVRQERLEINGTGSDPVGLHIALLDANQRQYRYRLTYVTQDNEVLREPFVETKETLIFIGE
jgi:hypothetical protein